MITLLYSLMITVEGKNLCERHKELNFKVKEAAKNKVDLQDVKCVDNSDVDRIFKIDLASEYKNVDYIFEELKSGDSLYISRALKCKWLYANEYAHLINPDFLRRNVFPMMSLKMRKKMLTIISVNIKDETRAELFYEYCKDICLINIANKFLILTSEPFKLSIFSNKVKCKMLFGDANYFRNLIGYSFTLANAYGEGGLPLVELSYLYSVNEAKYLDLLEKHIECLGNLGVKISRSIMKKHKSRVLQNAPIYLRILCSKVLLKYTSSNDAQIYLGALLPENEQMFWDTDYCNSFKHFIDILKTGSKFKFIKQIFEDKYRKSDFEMNSNFNELKYYNIMTFKEQEAWVLKHLQMQLIVTKFSSLILSKDDNYRWCEFMPFSKSLALLHNEICKTTDLDKRSAMLKVLVKSANTQKDLENLLNYYYNRHMFEPPQNKGRFIETVIKYYNVFAFNDACWVAFDMILQNFQLYNLIWPHNDFLIVSLIYRIIKDKTLPKRLRDYIHYGISYSSNFVMYVKRLKKEERDLVYEYLNSTIMKSILRLETQNYKVGVKRNLRHYIELWLNCREMFDVEDEYPDIVIKIMKLDPKLYRFILEIEPKNESKLTEGYLLRCLKQDASQIVEILPSLIDEFNNSERFRINMLLRKIKTYFSNDIAKQCLEFFTKTLYGELPNSAAVHQKSVYGIVFAIFQLGDEKNKTELMDKFAPKYPKIEQDKMGHNDYITQIAICRFQGYSRPPVPLCKTALYIKGDYLHKCEGMLYMHISNLPPTLRTDFIKLLLNSPSPIQRRGLELVFQKLRTDDLKDFFSNIWNDTNYMKLRKTIYMLTLKRMLTRKGNILLDVFSLLQDLTMTVQENDDDEILNCFTGDNVPENLRGLYLQTCWKKLGACPLTNVINARRKLVAKSIFINRKLISQEFLYFLIHDYVKKIIEQKIPRQIKKPEGLERILRRIQYYYITEMPNEESSFKIVELMTEGCFKRWNDEHPSRILYYQEVFNNFVRNIVKKPSYFSPKYLRIIPIAEKMLDKFEKRIGITETYSRFWDWKLALITRMAICGKRQCDEMVYVNFGFYLGDLVNKLKAKNCYYISFFDKVFGKISSSINEMNQKRIPSVSAVDASILISFGVLAIEIYENYVLALKILPDDLTVSPACRKALLLVLRRIKNQNNDEYEAFLKEKFNNSVVKVRKVIKATKKK